MNAMHRHMESLVEETHELLGRLGVPVAAFTGGGRASRSPITGEIIAHVHDASPADCERAIAAAQAAFLAWRTVPAPRRGELVRLLGEELRAAKSDLGLLVTLEAGKTALRGPGRGPGDDRHLRLRRGPVATAVRPDHWRPSDPSIA